MSEGGDRAREEFLSEAQEIVEGLGRDLLAIDEGLRGGKVDPGLINDVFRAVHTLKGLAGLFGASRMASLSHELEEVLDRLRLGKLDLSHAALDLLFRSVALYGAILQAEKDGRDQVLPQVDELIRDLNRHAGGAAPAPPGGEYELDPGLLAVLTEYEEHRLRTNIAEGLRLYRLRVQFQLATIDQALDELKGTAKPHGEIITYLPTGAGADADSIELDIIMASSLGADELRRALANDAIDLEEIAKRPAPASPSGPMSPLHVATPLPVAMPVSGHPSGSISPPSRKDGPISGQGTDHGTLRSVAQTVRVDIQKLDHLMNIVGELQIVRTSMSKMVERLAAAQLGRDLMDDIRRLSRAFERHLDTMQDGILEVRMVPLGQVFDKLARVVRQISREADKLVNLVITGAETEVDKLIVEELSDPLMHMIRNAIDHGIESRGEREAVGKPALGTIALNAFQKGNHVVIEIEDDGRGINAQRLVEAAVRRGLIGEEESRNQSRQEILNLVFVPGLSTKSGVSEISGRGVGMDVVKTNIGKLGGVIDLQSEEGIGTKVTVTLPITLAIISALIVTVEDRSFAIPLANVQEAMVLDPGTLRVIDGREVITVRSTSTLQLCRLSKLFGLEGEGQGASWGSPLGLSAGAARNPSQAGARVGSARQYVVVTSVGSRRLGLVVSGLEGEQDIVIQALGRSLKGVRGFAGAAQLGDQRIALVIDAPLLVEEVHAAGERGRPSPDPRSLHG